MKDYILLMHNDLPSGATDRDDDAWARYLARLQATGRFDGGSAIGDGACVSKSGPSRDITASIGGYLRVRAESLDEVRTLLSGNPVYEAGGTIEIRELPRSEAQPKPRQHSS